MARLAHIVDLPGPDAYLSLALRLRTQGKLVDAVWHAATAAQVSGGAAFFESNALAALLSAQLGRNDVAAWYWDKIIRSAPHKLNWLEAALKFAIGRENAGECLARWLKLFLNVYISTPSVSILSLLTSQGFGCPGSVGIHAGRLMGWVWLEKGRQTSLACEGVRDFRVALRPKGADKNHALYEINEELPKQLCVIAIRNADGEHIQGSPVVCSPAAMKTGKKSSDITIIIPAYDDYKATLCCLASVLASLKHNKTKPIILVAWDSGPDTLLLERLRRLAARRGIVLLENNRNLGFLASVNNAISKTRQGDIILLNADTIVHGDWIDRLSKAACAPGAATVTALSNEAELLSYPSAGDRGKVATLRHTAILDCAAAALPEKDAVVEIPVGVGFCMLITREALNRIGGLDGTGIFRGYGEEVDFCLRAREAGLRNYGAFNVFVAHLGERSFGAGKKALAAQNNVAIFERFPEYRGHYEHFLFQRQPKKLREQIALASLGSLEPLPILEIRPWSCRYLPPWVKDEQCQPQNHGAAIFLQPGPKPRALLRIWAEIPVMEMYFDLPKDRLPLENALASLKIDRTVAYAYAPSVLALAGDIGLDFRLAEAADLPLWQSAGERLLAAPPQSVHAFRALCSLAAKYPDKTFYVFHIDSLWGGAPRPCNILEMPRMEDFSLFSPDAFLLLDNFKDAPAWRYWLDCHNCNACIYEWKGDKP